VRVGCVGLGDIAQKAYLPVLGAQPDVELHLHTRTPATLDRIGDALHLRAGRRHPDLDSLLSTGLDAAFVHAPTTVHAELVTRLIDAGVPVYVDKPIAYDLADSERIVDLAKRRGVSLAVGFNRRYAPGYAECLDRPRDLILMRKNRAGLPADPRTVVLDDFIHVVDTLRFLAPAAVEDVDIRTRVRDGLLEHVVLRLSGDGWTAVGTMHRRGGAAEEVLDVSGGDTRREVRDLGEVIDHDGGVTRLRRRGDWVPVARQRGIEQITLAFLAAVRAGEPLTAEDALRTHRLCEQIVAAAG
jgi:virulence factor